MIDLTKYPPEAKGVLVAASPRTRWLIYALVDPREPTVVRYVGRTHSPIARYHAHTSGTRGVWPIELKANGVMPDMVLLEEVDEAAFEYPPLFGSHLESREVWWICHFQDKGQADLNSSSFQAVQVARRRRAAGV